MTRHTRTSHTRPIALLVALGLVLALAAPAAASTDLRSPDTRDAAATASYVDLRSPDSRDAAAPAVQAPGAEQTSSDDTSLDWGYYAGGALLLVALTGGAALMWRRRTPDATVAH